MKTSPEITCVGEVLVDFVSTTSGVSLSDAPAFAKKVGGAPANVAVALAKLGTRSGFVGKVGDDAFGRFLVRSLGEQGVDVSGVLFDPVHRTRLAFVSLTTSGERDFAFWEQHPADEQLTEREIKFSYLAGSKIVHISSFLLLKDPARSTAFRLAERLRRGGCRISFDPNLRLALWRSSGEARRAAIQMIKFADILRLNKEEALFLTGRKDGGSAAAALLRQGPTLVIVTDGRHGCSFHTESCDGAVPGFAVDAVDTTGCGDAFLAGVLHRLASDGDPLANLTEASLTLLCRYANAVGAITALDYGAGSSPTAIAVEEFLRGAT
jgi:fructokinase